MVIPESITLEFAQSWVRPRISDKRFRHIQGVVEVAKKLATLLSVNPFQTELAAWLHDSCKELKDKELVAKADLLGLPITPFEREHGHLLHGPVAACVAKVELGITDQLVLDAISQHTLGFAPMSKLSKILFLADCLEESRPKEYTNPIWKALDINGNVDLDSAIVVASNLNLEHLIEAGRPIHPKSVEVRNYYLDLIKQRSRST